MQPPPVKIAHVCVCVIRMPRAYKLFSCTVPPWCMFSQTRSAHRQRQSHCIRPVHLQWEKAGGMWAKCKSTTAGVPVPGPVRRQPCLFLSSKVRKFHCLLSDWAVMKMEMSLPQVTTKGGLFVGWTLHIHMHVTLWREGVQQSSLQQLRLQIKSIRTNRIYVFVKAV